MTSWNSPSSTSPESTGRTERAAGPLLGGRFGAQAGGGGGHRDAKDRTGGPVGHLGGPPGLRAGPVPPGLIRARWHVRAERAQARYPLSLADQNFTMAPRGTPASDASPPHSVRLDREQAHEHRPERTPISDPHRVRIRRRRCLRQLRFAMAADRGDEETPARIPPSPRRISLRCRSAPRQVMGPAPPFGRRALAREPVHQPHAQPARNSGSHEAFALVRGLLDLTRRRKTQRRDHGKKG